MKKYNFDYSKLLGRIKELALTQEDCAKKVGISETSLNYRLNNKRPFSQLEIKKLVALLEIEPTSINEYFFTEKV